MKFLWTDKSLQWFKRAARETQYYRQLVSKIAPWLESDMLVYDLGCGSGFFSMEIAARVRQVVAVDISAEAIEFLRARLKEKKIRNIGTVIADWHTWQPPQPADAVILSYCNGILENLQLLGALTKRHLIAVLPCSHRDDSFNVNKLVSGGEKVYGRETVPRVTRFLREKGIPYHFLDCTGEFGQPLDSPQEARDFLRFYFDIADEILLDEYLQEKLMRRGDDVYLPSKKRSGALIIARKDF